MSCPRSGYELIDSADIVTVVTFMPSKMKEGAPMPEESSAEDTANPSDMEELVQDPHQAS